MFTPYTTDKVLAHHYGFQEFSIKATRKGADISFEMRTMYARNTESMLQCIEKWNKQSIENGKLLGFYTEYELIA